MLEAWTPVEYFYYAGKVGGHYSVSLAFADDTKLFSRIASIKQG